jgi:hypothetical protein
MFDEDNYYDYDSIIRDADDLYANEYDEYDAWDGDDIEDVDQTEWENYYHNIADEIVDE